MSNYVVALTGGIGSGKSTVAELFASQGIDVIDADQVAREVVEPGTRGLCAITERFGPQILDASGALDRAALRERVFNAPAEREWLEQTLHPLIREEMERQLSASRSPYCIWMVPLLVENALHTRADRVLVIDLPEQTQLLRASHRDASQAEQIKRIMAAQAKREQRLAVADDVIDNSGDASQLPSQVEKLHRYYLQLAQPV